MSLLTDYEHETVVNFNQEDDFAIVTTNMRRVVTQLRNHPSAEIVIVDEYDGQTSYTFKIPAKLVTFRKPRNISDATRTKLAANARKAQEARRR